MSRTTSPDKRQRLVHILREAKQLLLGPRDDPTPLYRHGPFDLERQRAAEAGILEAIASDAPLPDVLRQIALAVDALNPGIVCSILLLDADLVHLRLGAAPHLPDAIARAFDGQPIGPNAGSCGTAAFTGQPVIVADIATDPRWTGFREPMQ
ncbi:MAG: GAF domain-containing protein, partial [Dongiaceae bacterium]